MDEMNTQLLAPQGRMPASSTVAPAEAATMEPDGTLSGDQVQHSQANDYLLEPESSMFADAQDYPELVQALQADPRRLIGEIANDPSVAERTLNEYDTDSAQDPDPEQATYSLRFSDTPSRGNRAPPRRELYGDDDDYAPSTRKSYERFFVPRSSSACTYIRRLLQHSLTLYRSSSNNTRKTPTSLVGHQSEGNNFPSYQIG